MADSSWLRGLRGDSSISSLTTPRTASRQASSRRTSDDGATPSMSDYGAEAGKPRPAAAPNSARGGLKAAPITPQAALKPPLPSAAKMTPRQARGMPALNLTRAVSADASDDDESPRSRVNSVSGDGSHTDEVTMEGDSVQVFVRVRPSNENELEATGASLEPPCMRLLGENTIAASMPGKNPKSFTYDKVLPEATSQHDVFEAAGVPMVDNCVSGYNSSIFVYGQTGAGKTFTMMGDLNITGDKRSEKRGLAPRMIELLFQKISGAEDAAGRESLKYSCRCSCLEIYNETITDLLNPAATNLQMREDPSRGIYVEDLSEKEVLNADDVMALMWKGNKNRHVGETNMNARSSRSHCVFTCVVERTSKNSANGVTSVVCSRLNLIDLAGSERIKGGALGGSQAQGEHFKEAVHINQSLTTLGRVIMELVEAQKGGGRLSQCHHIPYRDSRLTFLLQDSLGGNAKTMIIANVSPSPVCAPETVSTLKFVSRAKCIRNKATINMDYRGDVQLLQKEIVRLNVELDNLRKGFTDPAIQENKDLRQRLKAMEKQRDEDEFRMQGLATESQRYKKETERMKARLLEADEGNQDMTKTLEELQLRCLQTEAAGVEAQEAAAKVQSVLSEKVAAYKQQSEAAAMQLQQLEALSAEQQQVLQQTKVQLLKELATTSKLVQALEQETTALKSQAEEAEEAKAALAVLYAEAREGLEAEKGRSTDTQAQAVQLEAQVAELTQRCETLSSNMDKEQQALHTLQLESASHVAALKASQQESASQVTVLRAQLEEAQKTSAQQGADAAAMHAAGIAQSQELAATQEQLIQEQQAHAKSKAALIERAAEQERRLRAEVEQQIKEQQSLRLQLAESELLVASEREKQAGLQAALTAEGTALAQSRGWAGELTERVQGLEAVVAQGQRKLAEGEEQQRELRAQLAQQQSQLEAQQAASSGEASRMGAERQALQALIAELRESGEAAAAVNAEQLQALAGMKQGAEQAAEGHARQVAELQQTMAAMKRDAEQAAEEHARHVAELHKAIEGVKQDAEQAAEGHTQQAAELQKALEGMQQDAERAAEGHAKQVAELQQAQDRLTEIVAGLRQENAQLKAGVEDKSAAADTLRTDLEASRRAAEEVQQQLQASCSDAQASKAKLAAALQVQERYKGQIAEQQDCIRSLQREVISAQEQLAAKTFEMGLQTATAEKLRGEHAAVQQLLEARSAELSSTRANLAQREQEIADAQQELKATYDGKSDMENQMKGFLVTNTRQARAFQEIQRLINWATTPPSSVTSSLAHHESSTPTGLMVGGELLPSPTNSPDQIGARQRGAKAGQRQGCISMAEEVDQPQGQVAQQAAAKLARLSLHFDGADDGGADSQGRLGQSPGGSVRSKRVDQVLGRMQAEDDDVHSPAASVSKGKDQVK